MSAMGREQSSARGQNAVAEPYDRAQGSFPELHRKSLTLPSSDADELVLQQCAVQTFATRVSYDGAMQRAAHLTADT